MSTYTSEPGTRLGGRYRLEDRVASAGGWSAWKAIDEILARPVSVITFAAGFPRFEQVVTAARAASRLTDTRLMQVFDVEDSWDQGYVVLEWPVGETLADLLSAGPMEPIAGARIMAEAASALSAAHAAGLAHLCLRPDAVRWTVGGGVKITGLGIEAALEGITAEDPERADTEGLGQLLYAAITGLWPGADYPELPPAPTFEGQPRRPRQVRAGVPTALDDVVSRTLSLDGREEHAYTSPAELAAALYGVLPPVQVPAAAVRSSQAHYQPPPRSREQAYPGYRPGPPGRSRSPVRVALVALAVLVAVVGVSAAALHLLQSPGSSHRHHAGTSAGHTTPVAKVVTLRPAAAHGFDALDLGDTGDENNALAANVIDGNPQGWTTQYYYGANAAHFGGYKSGTGLILTMAGRVQIKSITVRFGSIPGADVEIKVGNSDARSAANLRSMTTIASANDVSGSHAFYATKAVSARYVVIWFTKLPPMAGSKGRYMAQVFGVTIKGTD
jgi:hypothetical protein